VPEDALLRKQAFQVDGVQRRRPPDGRPPVGNPGTATSERGAGTAKAAALFGDARERNGRFEGRSLSARGAGHLDVCSFGISRLSRS
jgi:hypothetical protein